MKLFSFSLALVLFFQSEAQNAKSFVEDPEWRNFEIMAEYLSDGSGKWTGLNKNHDPSNDSSPEAFGLWFERPMPTLMTLRIVAYMGDTVRVSSQGVFSWHPIEKQVIHVMSDVGNGYSDGISTFPNETSFISTMKVFRPDGATYDHRDENFIVSENVHRNTSFGKDEQGNWIERGNWTWTRDPEGG